MAAEERRSPDSPSEVPLPDSGLEAGEAATRHSYSASLSAGTTSEDGDGGLIEVLRNGATPLEGYLKEPERNRLDLAQRFVGVPSPKEIWWDRHSVSQWLFGVPCSQAFNLRRLRLQGTSDRKFREIVQNLVQVRCCDAEDVNDVSTMLRDTRVQWSFFDIIEVDVPPTSLPVISMWSVVGQFIASILAWIAFYSIWYSTLVSGFHDVLKYDMLVGPDTSIYKGLEGLDLSLDVVYLLCTLTRLRTTYIDHFTYLETCSPDRIRQRTLNSLSFWSDIVSCIPFLILHHVYPSVPEYMRCVKLARFRHFLPWVFDWQGGTSLVMRPYWQSVLRLVLFIVICGHLCGCMWYQIASPERHPLLEAAAGGPEWAEPDTASRPLFLYYSYFAKTGLYITLGIIVQGYSVTENLLIVLMAPIGAFTNAFIFSSIVVLVSRSTASKTNQIEGTEKLKQAIRTQCLPASLQLRIFAYHTQQRVHRCRSQTNTLFRGLSSQLKFELNLVLYFNLIMEAHIFKKSHPMVLRKIILVFEDKLFLPGDYVCRYGDEGTEMYFIFKGRCTIFSESHAFLKLMSKGEHFGEVSLLTGQKRTAYVRSNSFTTLASLAKSDFDSIMRQHPKQLDLIMAAMSDKRRQWMQRLVQNTRGSGSFTDLNLTAPRPSLTPLMTSLTAISSDGGGGGGGPTAADSDGGLPDVATSDPAADLPAGPPADQPPLPGALYPHEEARESWIEGRKERAGGEEEGREDDAKEEGKEEAKAEGTENEKKDEKEGEKEDEKEEEKEEEKEDEKEEEKEEAKDREGPGGDNDGDSSSSSSSSSSDSSSCCSSSHVSTEEDQGHDGDAESCDTNIPQIIETISRRCQMALQTQSDICEQLKELVGRQGVCADLASGLNFQPDGDWDDSGRRDDDTDFRRHDRTVMLECISNDVDTMHRLIKETNVYAARNMGAASSDFFSSAIVGHDREEGQGFKMGGRLQTCRTSDCLGQDADHTVL